MDCITWINEVRALQNTECVSSAVALKYGDASGGPVWLVGIGRGGGGSGGGDVGGEEEAAPLVTRVILLVSAVVMVVNCRVSCMLLSGHPLFKGGIVKSHPLLEGAVTSVSEADA